jgi:ABC-type dipeptide/oligopeptide/nickel transport system permease component
MFAYILKRLALFLPTWGLISVIVFALSRCASGDAVTEKLRSNAESTTGQTISKALYTETAIQLGLDKPTFYFSIVPAAFPDTFYKILKRDERKAAEELVWQYGNWATISNYRQAVAHFLSDLEKTPIQPLIRRDRNESERVSRLQNEAAQLPIQSDTTAIQFYLNKLRQIADTSLWQGEVKKVSDAYNALKINPARENLYFPKLSWYGFDNQYHHWLKKVLSGDFGDSKKDMTVAKRLHDPLSITAILGSLTLILSFLIGILLGVYVAMFRHKRRGQWLMRGLFAIYAMPNFWLATLGAMYLATPYYGLQIVEGIGLSPDIPVGANVWQVLWLSANRLILPIICLAIHPITVIARQMQASVTAVLSQDYIKTAQAKGLSKQQVIWKHAVRNALTPIATLLGSMIPAVVGGAFAIEMIFSIPGMGMTAVEAIQSDDWQVVYAVLLLVSAVILLGNLLTDILYKWLNPRIVYQ